MPDATREFVHDPQSFDRFRNLPHLRTFSMAPQTVPRVTAASFGARTIRSTPG
jgi:hypothetical protein